MASRNLIHSDPAVLVDGRWEVAGNVILVEIKKTSSVRDLRDVFLALAYLLRQEAPASQAVCVVIDTRLSQARLQEELDGFRAVLHPLLADRIHFLMHKVGTQRGAVAFSGSLQGLSPAFHDWLAGLVATQRQTGQQLKQPPRQVVLAALAHLRLANRSPVTVKHLQERCAVSYPTVAAVLKELAAKGWLEDSGARGVRLRYLTVGEWMDLASEHARLRKVQFFFDPTQQSSPEHLAGRLERLQAKGKLPRSIRIGGVLGASHHFPALDITAAPRLDLSIASDPSEVAAVLDAGLLPKSRPDQRTALALHLSCDAWNSAGAGDDGAMPWAGELECLADLVEMGLTREAAEMAHHMEVTNKQGQMRHDTPFP